MATRDYYDILGVGRGASDDDIRQAYRRLAREHHPDVSEDPAAAERFAEIGAAYEVLSDTEKRRAYDRFGHAGVRAGARDGGPGGPAWSSGGPFGGAGGPGAGPDLGDLFDHMFSGRGGPFGGSRPRSRRGGDLEHEITVSFMTAALGGREALRLRGPGAASERLTVTIPPGIQPGARLRMKGKGRRGAGGGAPGDLIVTVQVGDHPLYRRDGLDLLVDVPLTIAEATLGCTVSVPLLPSGTVDLKVPPGASSGQKLRVRGRGVKDAEGRTGDLYAVVQIVTPRRLSAEASEALRSIEAELQNPRDLPPWADKG